MQSEPNFAESRIVLSNSYDWDYGRLGRLGREEAKPIQAAGAAAISDFRSHIGGSKEESGRQTKPMRELPCSRLGFHEFFCRLGRSRQNNFPSAAV